VFLIRLNDAFWQWHTFLATPYVVVQKVISYLSTDRVKLIKSRQLD